MHRPDNLKPSTIATISGLQINSFTSLLTVLKIPFRKIIRNKFLLSVEMVMAMALISLLSIAKKRHYNHNSNSSLSSNSHSSFSTHLGDK